MLTMLWVLGLDKNLNSYISTKMQRGNVSFMSKHMFVLVLYIQFLYICSCEILSSF